MGDPTTHTQTIISSGHLDVHECRRLLGPAADAMDEGALERVRDALYELAWTVCALYVADADRATEEAALAHFAADDREALEERAAMLQFDAKMSRANATRSAISLSLKLPSPISRVSRPRR
jgi:hypothetical protein